MNDVLNSSLVLALFGGLLLNGFWTGDMLILMVGVRSKGRSWASRTDDPWMFWFLAVFYSVFTLLGAYFLIRGLSAQWRAATGFEAAAALRA